MGGVPSSHISYKCEMAIIDRTFCSLDAMAHWKFHGKTAKLFFKVGSCGWKVQSDCAILREAQIDDEDKKEEQNDNDDMAVDVDAI